MGFGREGMTKGRKYSIIGFMTESRDYSSERVLSRFFLTVFLGAMILGPILFFALDRIFPLPFHRAMDRALLVSALAALGLARSQVDLRAWWRWDGGAWKQALLGLGIALVSTQLILGLEAAFVGLTWLPLTSKETHHVIFTAIVAAIFVPLAEETLFRGFIQTQLVRGLGARWGCFLGALIFMLAHFLKVPVVFDRAPVHAWSGMAAFGAAFLPVLHGDFLGARGLNLLLIGLVLGATFLRTGTLWLNYGLHGGWIVALLVVSGLTRPAATVSFWGGDNLSTPLTTIVLVLLGFWLWLFYRRPSPEPDPGATAP
jgi:membrane protease YdiL (CAAX protease family)